MADVVLVTGAGRQTGIGYEVCRQLAQGGWSVILTARDEGQARQLAGSLGDLPGRVVGVELDVTQPHSRRAVAHLIETEFGRLDVLINNAAGHAVYGETTSDANLDSAKEMFDTVLFGSWALTQDLLTLLERSEHPRVVNVSSGAGSHGDPVFGLTSGNAMGPAYSMAKAALNALTAVMARELGGRFRVNAVCPGFTATFPGGQEMGARPVAEGASGIVWTAKLPCDGPSGGLFRDGRPLPW
jgi:NAD(P)-dependent dehydrogenase (short-subunit alcohol dehydrogenase family)